MKKGKKAGNERAREVIKRMLVEFYDGGLPAFYKREVDSAPYIETKSAVVITGPRMAGKTYMMYQFMKELAGGLRNCVYINFEDNRLVDFTYLDFEEILNAYYELNPGKEPILFLDEIHVVDYWHLFVRRLVDRGFKVFITGSNSRLLSREYATHIAGRHIEIALLPFSFRELVSIKGLESGKDLPYSKKRFEIMQLLEEYLIFGGLPDVALAKSKELKFKLLEGYLNTVVYKDLMARFKISDGESFKTFIKKIVENIGNPFSIYNIEKKMDSMGYTTTRKTLQIYLKHLEEGFFAIPSELFQRSLSKRETEKRMYIIDNGYLNLFLIKEDKGKQMENLIAVEIFRRKGELYYFRGEKEVDFASPIPIQSCFDVSDALTYEREVSALESYLAYSKKKMGIIVTWDKFEKIERNGKEIRFVPLYYFLLYPEEFVK